MEELGFATTLLPVFNFVYKANFENGLIEHEFDHVYFGTYEGKVYPNRKEVMSVEFKTMETIASEIKNDPTKFTAWFNLAFDRVYNWWHLQHSR
jgi:isopentenyl-diphosphate delta-isomerase